MMMGLQFVGPASELRIVMGLHGVDNIPMAVKFIEAVRPGMGPEDLVVFAVDMVEMTERAAATLVKGEGPDAVTVGDEAIAEMRKEIGEALLAYHQENGDGLKIRRLLAVSSFSDMHKDICSCATDVGAVVIVLPFHKKQKMDGSMDGGHPGFRQVNQKVISHSSLGAPRIQIPAPSELICDLKFSSLGRFFNMRRARWASWWIGN